MNRRSSGMRTSPRHGLLLRGFCTAITVVALVAVSPGPDSPIAVPVAQASMSYAIDRDRDLLGDVFERHLGTNLHDPDTDADGIPDGFEYILRSDPLDSQSRPTLKPTLRMSACFSGGFLRITFYILPADVSELTAFACFLLTGHQAGRQPPIDISAMVPTSVTEADMASYSGVCASAFTLAFPMSIIKRIAPVSIGMAAKISGVCQADVVNIDVVDGVPMVARGMGIPPEIDPTVDDQHLPWDPLTDDVPDNWGDQQVCVTSQTEVGCDNGIATYEITSAGCDSSVNRSCPPSCASRVGGTVTSIDYAFLIASVSGF